MYRKIILICIISIYIIGCGEDSPVNKPADSDIYIAVVNNYKSIGYDNIPEKSEIIDLYKCNLSQDTLIDLEIISRWRVYYRNDGYKPELPFSDTVRSFELTNYFEQSSKDGTWHFVPSLTPRPEC